MPEEHLAVLSGMIGRVEAVLTGVDQKVVGLGDKLDRVDQKVDSHGEQISRHDERIGSLERARQDERADRSTLRIQLRVAIASGVIGASGGVIGALISLLHK